MIDSNPKRRTPKLDPYLPISSSKGERGTGTGRQFAARLLDDQRARWEQGDRKTVADYLQQFPELAADPEGIVDLLYQEVLLRKARGEVPRLSDYLRRFPHYATRLGQQFDLHEFLEAGGLAKTVETRLRIGQAPTGRVGRVLEPELPAIPGYEMVRELGRGGMGVCYLARQVRLKRDVVVKMIRDGSLARPEQLARFRAEAEAIAHLKHPHIVQIYEVGEVASGPYLVLEWVEGGSLADQLAGKPQPAAWTARLVETLARASQHAHQRGIVHRDLKPANVLLTCEGTPKITDFGLAKRVASGPSATDSGFPLGTVNYMPPEQACPKTQEIGPAADVYALGAILYEMLSGRPPFLGGSHLETILKVVTEEPVPPRQLQPKVPRDLETICLKCLEKKPAQRYPSATALADDLARYLAGQPIQARPIRAWERGIKWARRQPALAALTVATLASAVIGFALIAWQWQAAEAARGLAEQAHQSEKTQRQLAEVARQEQADQRKRFQQLSLNMMVDGGLQGCEQGEVARGLFQLVRGLELAGDNHQDWQRVIRINLADWTRSLCPLKTCLSHRSQVLAAAISPDGRLAVTGCADKKALLWDLTAGEPVGKPLFHSWRVNAVAFSADGKRMVTGAGNPGDAQGEARVWDVASGRPLGEPLNRRGPVWAVAFSSDGRKILTASSVLPGCKGVAQWWDAATGKPVGPALEHPRPIRAVAISPDGKLVLTGCDDRFARYWDTGSGELVRELKTSGYVEAVAFSVDGKTILTGSRDSLVRVWDVKTGNLLGQPLKHQGFIQAVASSPDGKTILSGGRDGVARLWDASTGHCLTILPHQDQVTAVAFGPDGKTLLTGSLDRSARVWRKPAGKLPQKTLAHATQVCAAALSPDGQVAAICRNNGSTQLWHIATGKPLGQPMKANSPVHAVTFSPNGKFLLAGYDDKCARLWEAATGELRGEPLEHSQPVLALAFAADGATFLTGCAGGKVRCWDTATGKPVGPVLAHPGAVRAVAFDPANPSIVLTGCTDKTARLWDINNGRCLKKFAHQGPVWSVAFSPDGQRLVTGCEDGTVRLWNAPTGQSLDPGLRHPGGVVAVAFSPDGRILVTGCRDGKARLWDVTTRKMLGMPMAHQGAVRTCAFSHDGHIVLTVAEELTARLWEVPTSLTGEVQRIRLWLQVGTGLDMDDAGVIRVLDSSTWLERRRAFGLEFGSALAY
jgi:WD40 repeat protein